MEIKRDQIPLITTHDFPQQSATQLKPIIDIINSQTIDKELLSKYLKLGILDDAHQIREYVWKIVLGYLPKEKSQWINETTKKEGFYRDHLMQFLPNGYPPQDCPQDQKDYNLWLQIQKDTVRTQPNIPFFKQIVSPMPYPLSEWKNQEVLSKKQVREEEKVTYRYSYMTRILFIFAKLNPLVQYAQGMNELLAPIFYVVNHSPQKHIQEAACFFMFANVMSDIIFFHIKGYDNQENQFHHRVNKILDMLLVIDSQTWLKLETLKIDPFYYLFRWITLLFAQEFPIEKTIRIWQCIFSYKDRKAFVNAFCLALILASKEKIAVGSFSDIIQHLNDINSHIKLEEMVVEARQFCQSDEQWWQKVSLEDELQKIEQKQQEKQEENSGSWITGFFKHFL